MDMNMKDRVAIVTGGSKGIGLAVARRFADRRQGRDRGARRAGSGGGATALAKDGLDVRDYVCDVAKAADIAAPTARSSRISARSMFSSTMPAPRARWRSRT